jgi:hypothetical protein
MKQAWGEFRRNGAIGARASRSMFQLTANEHVFSAVRPYMTLYRVRSAGTMSPLSSSTDETNQFIPIESAAQRRLCARSILPSVSTRGRFESRNQVIHPNTHPISLVSGPLGRQFSDGSEISDRPQPLRTARIMSCLPGADSLPLASLRAIVVHDHRETLLREIPGMYAIPEGRMPPNQRNGVLSNTRSVLSRRDDRERSSQESEAWFPLGFGDLSEARCRSLGSDFGFLRSRLVFVSLGPSLENSNQVQSRRMPQTCSRADSLVTVGCLDLRSRWCLPKTAFRTELRREKSTPFVRRSGSFQKAVFPRKERLCEGFCRPSRTKYRERRRLPTSRIGDPAENRRLGRCSVKMDSKRG